MLCHSNRFISRNNLFHYLWRSSDGGYYTHAMEGISSIKSTQIMVRIIGHELSERFRGYTVNIRFVGNCCVFLKKCYFMVRRTKSKRMQQVD